MTNTCHSSCYKDLIFYFLSLYPTLLDQTNHLGSYLRFWQSFFFSVMTKPAHCPVLQEWGSKKHDDKLGTSADSSWIVVWCSQQLYWGCWEKHITTCVRNVHCRKTWLPFIELEGVCKCGQCMKAESARSGFAALLRTQELHLELWAFNNLENRTAWNAI